MKTLNKINTSTNRKAMLNRVENFLAEYENGGYYSDFALINTCLDNFLTFLHDFGIITTSEYNQYDEKRRNITHLKNIINKRG